MRHEGDDAELVRRCLAGDRPSQETVVREYLPMVLSMAHGFTRDRALAEDLAQEVFEKVFRSLGGFRGESRLRTWIYSIAVTHGINFVRRKMPGGVEIGQYGDVPASASSPEQDALDAETYRAVHGAVDRLPEKYKTVMVLSAFENMTALEISAKLGIPEGTVFSRLSKGRQILCHRLGPFMRAAERRP